MRGNTFLIVSLWFVCSIALPNTPTHLEGEIASATKAQRDRVLQTPSSVLTLLVVDQHVWAGCQDGTIVCYNIKSRERIQMLEVCVHMIGVGGSFFGCSTFFANRRLLERLKRMKRILKHLLYTSFDSFAIDNKS
jgi:hypothetical protein